MKQQFELLAPGGDLDSIKAAIIAGADAVYCGLDSFNARKRATNLSLQELSGLIPLAHKHHCQIFLTLNIIILENEIGPLIKLLNQLVNIKIDGVIVQDLGLFYLLKSYFPSLDVHASTQVTMHNEGQISFFNKLGVSRVNLSRELNIDEVKSLTSFAYKHHILTEVFVHGSYCIGFSGICYISSVQSGNSGNRGRCSQPCRDQYKTTAMGSDYPLNLKDNSAFFDLPALADAGVYSLKIEGRIKGASYVHSVVSSWREQLQRFYQNDDLLSDNSSLYKVFNRDFSDGFLKGNINKLMFIDNPRDHSLKHIELQYEGAGDVKIKQAKQALYEEKKQLVKTLAEKIAELDISPEPVTIEVSGQLNRPLEVRVSSKQGRFVVLSQSLLRQADEQSINRRAIEKRFKSLNTGQVVIAQLQLDNLDAQLSIPFKELSLIKERIAFFLNGSVDSIAPVSLPALQSQTNTQVAPSLSVLISSIDDLPLSAVSNIDIHYKLPDGFAKENARFIKLFQENKRLIAWFPSLLIADDYHAAVAFLKELQPAQIVTNNLGIAYVAAQLGINWVAGPYLNITNSYSLLSLQNISHCTGAFISNEINKKQISLIQAPENFSLFYSMYHPILLMSSRQCFFQQTVGCKKLTIDQRCIQKCHKSAQIINLQGVSFTIDKQKGGYPSIYSDQAFLNCEIVSDLGDKFNTFLVDFSELGALSLTVQDKKRLVDHFQALLKGDCEAEAHLKAAIANSTNAQYKKGL
ncbi:peptidase U32 family protein [Psychromonas sp. MME2]|uniref:peptidase U32 family protein n=1 Tax=unclassified Psychromonas TaxID=2614957 RepID=UPI00339CF52F